MQNFLGSKAILMLVTVAIIVGGIGVYYASAQGLLPFAAELKSTCQLAVEKWEDASPDLVRSKVLFTGTPAAVDYVNTPHDRAKEFKSVIDAAVADGPDLAGKYAVAQWSCGTSCQEHAIVNMETGKIVAFGFPSEAGVSMSDRHNVIITNPAQNMPKQADVGRANPDSLAYLLNIPREYFILHEIGATTTLQKICTENPFEGFEI